MRSDIVILYVPCDVRAFFLFLLALYQNHVVSQKKTVDPVLPCCFPRIDHSLIW